MPKHPDYQGCPKAFSNSEMSTYRRKSIVFAFRKRPFDRSFGRFPYRRRPKLAGSHSFLRAVILPTANGGLLRERRWVSDGIDSRYNRSDTDTRISTGVRTATRKQPSVQGVDVDQKRFVPPNSVTTARSAPEDKTM